jgi:hypothetical protein
MTVAPMTAKMFCHICEDVVSVARPCVEKNPASAAGAANSSATTMRRNGARTSVKTICAAARVAPPARSPTAMAPSGPAPL